MATWICSSCHTYNPVGSTRCIACGAELSGESTVHRSAPTPEIPLPPSGTTEDASTAPDDEFPWPIIIAAAVAFILVAGVIGLVVAQGDKEAPKIASTTSSTVVATTSTSTSTSTTTSTPSTTTTPRSSTTIPPTTLPPLPQGVSCPSGEPTSGLVVIHDAGQGLLFRKAPDTSAPTVDRASNGDTVRFWARADTSSVGLDNQFRVQVLGQLPGNSSSCGWVSVLNIKTDPHVFDRGAPAPAGCDSYEGSVVAVDICGDGAAPTLTVTWKPQSSNTSTVQNAVRQGSGWQAQNTGSNLVYFVDDSHFTVTNPTGVQVNTDIQLKASS